MNAKKELLEHIRDREVKYIRIVHRISYDHQDVIEGSLADVLPELDFDYEIHPDQELRGSIIWYTDGTWSDRNEYDGYEWWEYRKCPRLPQSAT